MKDPLKIIPLGGLGEIGLNMMVIESGDAIMIVDAGLMFPEDYMLGIDMVIPETGYLKDKAKQIQGIVLTHGHEDHIGALPYLAGDLPVPIYGTRFTIALVKDKLRAHDITPAAPWVVIRPREKHTIGPFHVEFIRVSHSVVDGVGLGIHTPQGLIVHSGDFKINQIPVQGELTDMNRFADLGERGVLALLSDSTNVEREGYTLSEKEIGQRLHAIFQDCPGRIIIALFSSNVARIQQIVEGAGAEGRKIVFCGRSMQANVAIAKDLGFLDVPEDMEIHVGQIKEMADRDVVIVTTGSQGEPMSVLHRIAMGMHKQIKVQDGDTVILSSKFIPGNERAITHIINRLYKEGAEVIYEKVSDIHVSGHAFQEELKLMMNLTKPKYFIPIHGEFRHLIRHARLAKEVGIPEERVLLAENGNIVVFDENGARIEGAVQAGRVLVHGKGVGDVERYILKERQFLSEEGLVMVTIVIDGHTGRLVRGPFLESHGFVEADHQQDILDKAGTVVTEILEQWDVHVPDRIDMLKAGVKKSLRKYFYSVFHRKPVIFPVIVEV